jgi:hypothetical protein
VGIILRFEPVLNPKRTEPGVRFEVQEIARTEPEVRFGVREFLEKTEPNRTPATLVLGGYYFDFAVDSGVGCQKILPEQGTHASKVIILRNQEYW